MILVSQFWGVYRISIFGFGHEQILPGKPIPLVPPIIVWTGFSVLPGFGPAAEVPSAWLRTGLFFRKKDAKPLTPSLPHSMGRTRIWGERANSLHSNKARRLMRASLPWARQQASEYRRRTYQWPRWKRRESSILCDPSIMMRKVVVSPNHVGKLFESLEIVFETGSSK